MKPLYTTYTYDAQGNTMEECLMRRSTKPEEKWDILQRKRYQYTDFHQTRQVEIENLEKQTKEVQENFYDAENLRYAIKENGKQTNFVTDGWEILSEMDEKGSVEKRLIRGYELTVFEEKKKKEEVSEGRYYYYHTNEHGDIEGITEEKGGVCNCYQYDAFGKIMEEKWEIENRYTYSGKVYDGVTEQYYLRARNYNPQTARFTQEDVYRGDGLNLYVYCLNNAVMYIDPSGYGRKCKKEGNKTTGATVVIPKYSKKIYVMERI